MSRAAVVVLTLLALGACDPGSSRPSPTLPPIARPSSSTASSTTPGVTLLPGETSTTAGASAVDLFDETALLAECAGPCVERGSINVGHLALGLGRMSWLVHPDGTTIGVFFLADGAPFDVRWGGMVDDVGAQFVEVAIDSLTHVWFRAALTDGRSAALVFVPTPDGYIDLSTLKVTTSQLAGEATAFHLDARGRIEADVVIDGVTATYRWDGFTYTTG